MPCAQAPPRLNQPHQPKLPSQPRSLGKLWLRSRPIAPAHREDLKTCVCSCVRSCALKGPDCTCGSALLHKHSGTACLSERNDTASAHEMSQGFVYVCMSMHSAVHCRPSTSRNLGPRESSKIAAHGAGQLLELLRNKSTLGNCRNILSPRSRPWPRAPLQKIQGHKGCKHPRRAWKSVLDQSCDRPLKLPSSRKYQAQSLMPPSKLLRCSAGVFELRRES